MKATLKLFLFSLTLSLFIFPDSAQAVVHPGAEKSPSIMDGRTDMANFSLDDIVHLNARQLGKKRGKKLKLKERIAFLILKKEIKSARKKGKSDAEIIQQFNEPRDSGKETACFILGLLLGLLGVLIAYLAFKKQAKFAWYGLLTYLGVLALILFYSFYNQ